MPPTTRAPIATAPREPESAARPGWTSATLRGRRSLLVKLGELLSGRGARLVVRGPLGVGKASLLAAWQAAEEAQRVTLWLDAERHVWRDSLRQLAAQTGWREDARPDAQQMVQHIGQWLAERDGTLVVRHAEVATAPSWRLLPLLGSLQRDVRVAVLAESVPADCEWPVLDVPPLSPTALVDWHGLQPFALDTLGPDWLRPQALRLLAAASRVLAATEGEASRDELVRLVQRPAKDGPPPLESLMEFALGRMAEPAKTLALCLAAMGGEAEELSGAAWIGAELPEYLRDLAEWGWLTAHPADAGRLYLVPAVHRHLRSNAAFPAVQGAFERFVARAVQRHFDRRAQRHRLASGTAPLHLVILAAVDRGALALASSLLDLAAELLVEAGLADSLGDLAQAVLDAAPPSSPAANTASYGLALAYRAGGELELADALLVDTLRAIASSHGLQRHAPVCVSRFAAPRSQPASLDDWLESPPPPATLPWGEPTELGLEESDTRLLAWLEGQSPRADRRLLAARIRGEHAKTLRLLRQPISAWRTMTPALPTLRTLPRHDDRARWLAEAALCQAGVGEWSEAAALLQASAAAWRACEQYLAEAETLGRLAAWREYSGEMEEARTLRETAQALRDRHGLVGDPQDLRDRADRSATAADALLEAGRSEDARKLLAEAIEAWRKLGAKDDDPRLQELLARLARLTE